MSGSKANKKTRPILFSGPMVRAILAGEKSQTRRVVKPQPVIRHRSLRACKLAEALTDGVIDGRREFEALPESIPTHPEHGGLIRCPYGQPGDRLWVRETWAHYHTVDHIRRPDGRAFSEVSDGLAGYRADGFGGIDDFVQHIRLMCDRDLEDVVVKDNHWRPSIHMPRWASRITLEVLDVRVERVQDISEEDAIAEGLTEYFWPDDLHPEVRARVGGKRYWERAIKDRCSGVWDCPIKAFRELWDSINAKPKPVVHKGKVVHYVSYPWGVRYPRVKLRETGEHRGLPWHVYGNPWVWVTEFKRIEE